MQDFIMSLISSLLLVLAVSLDSFAASFAYGTSNIKIPFTSIMIITGICAGMLTISLLLGTVIAPLLPENLPKLLSFLTLLIIGFIKLGDGIIKSKIQNGKNMDKKLTFSIFNLHFILNIYADPKKADKDQSNTLSPAESVSLAIALSLDGIAVGFGAALSNTHIFAIVILATIICSSSIIIGDKLGRKAGEKLPLKLTWIGGAFLIALAFTKL